MQECLPLSFLQQQHKWTTATEHKWRRQWPGSCWRKLKPRYRIITQFWSHTLPISKEAEVAGSEFGETLRLRPHQQCVLLQIWKGKCTAPILSNWVTVGRQGLTFIWKIVIAPPTTFLYSEQCTITHQAPRQPSWSYKIWQKSVVFSPSVAAQEVGPSSFLKAHDAPTSHPRSIQVNRTYEHKNCFGVFFFYTNPSLGLD